MAVAQAARAGNGEWGWMCTICGKLYNLQKSAEGCCEDEEAEQVEREQNEETS